MYKIRLNSYLKTNGHVEECSEVVNKEQEEEAIVVFQNLKMKQHRILESKYGVEPKVSNQEIRSISGDFMKSQKLEYKSDDGETYEYYEITYFN